MSSQRRRRRRRGVSRRTGSSRINVTILSRCIIALLAAAASCHLAVGFGPAAGASTSGRRTIDRHQLLCGPAQAVRRGAANGDVDDESSLEGVEKQAGIQISRRYWIARGLAAAAVIGSAPLVTPAEQSPSAGVSTAPAIHPVATKVPASNSTSLSVVKASNATNLVAKPRNATSGPAPAPAPKKEAKTKAKAKIEPLDLKKIAEENKVEVIVLREDEKECRKVDSATLTRTTIKNLPWWVPQFLRPKVVERISNTEVLLAGTVAGAVTEVVRTTLCYPLSTIKARIQANTNQTAADMPRLDQKIEELGISFREQAAEGNLFAGIVPTLLVAVPSSGVYFGIRDVTKRMLKEASATASPYDDIFVALVGALVADVVAISVSTPADVLALRLQVTGDGNETKTVGNWLGDSLALIPANVLTDLPFLLARISLNYAIMTGSEGLGTYAEEYILVSILCAALTTPFDVARTRILTDNSEYRIGASPIMKDTGVLRTMRAVTKEGGGGISNLFAGWIERTVYLGIGRAWFDPFRILFYLGIRDAVLLTFFGA